MTIHKKIERPKRLICSRCDAYISQFMGECFTRGLCQNCATIEQMSRDGTLAKNGLMTTDF